VEGVGQPPVSALTFSPSSLVFLSLSSSDRALVASCWAQSPVSSLLASLPVIDNKVRRNSSSDSIDRAHYIASHDRVKRTAEAVPQSPNMNVPGQYLVEPFLPDDQTPASPTHNTMTSPTHNTMPPAPTSAYSNTQSDGSASGTQPTAPHVYVVHHDGGGAPVTVFTGGGGVTELPPSYVGRPDEQPPNQPAVGGSNNFEPTDRRPRPGPTPRKSSTPGFR